jgi:subfamily B ATP-binding cassette protein HlyB/CyaB
MALATAAGGFAPLIDDIAWAQERSLNPVHERYATVLALHRIAVDPAQLRHSLGHDRPIEADDLKRIAKRQEEVRAKSIRTKFEKLAQTPLPALANGPSGWFIIAKVSDDEVLIQPPCRDQDGVQPQIMKIDRSALEAMWSGELLLVTSRRLILADRKEGAS